MAVYDEAGRGEVYPESQEGLLDTLVATKSPEEIERMRLALGAAGVVNPAADAIEGAIAYKQGDTLGAALALGSMLLPIPLGMVLGRGGKGAKAAGLTDDILAGFRPVAGDTSDAISMGREKGHMGLRDFYVPEIPDYDKAAYYSGDKPWLSYLHAQSPEMTPEGVFESDLVQEMYKSLDDDVVASMRHKYSEAPELFEGVTMLDERTPMPFSHFYTDMGDAVGRSKMSGDDVATALQTGGLQPGETSGLSWISTHPNFLEGVVPQHLQDLMDQDTGLQTTWGGGRNVAGRFNDLVMRPSGTVFDPWYDAHAEKFTDVLKAKGGEASQAYANLNIIESMDNGLTASKFGKNAEETNIIGIHNIDANHSGMLDGFDPYDASDNADFMGMQAMMHEMGDDFGEVLEESQNTLPETLMEIIEGHRDSQKLPAKKMTHQLTDSFEPIKEIIDGTNDMADEYIAFPPSWMNQTAERLRDPKFRANLTGEEIRLYEMILMGEDVTWKDFYSVTQDGLRTLTKKFDNAKYSKVLADNDLAKITELGEETPGAEKVKEASKWFKKNPGQERLNPMYFGNPFEGTKGRDENYLVNKLFGSDLYLESDAMVNTDHYDGLILDSLRNQDSWKFQEQMFHNVAGDFKGGLRQIEPGYVPWESDDMGFENFAVPKGTGLKSASGVFQPMPGFAEDIGEFSGIESIRMPHRGRFKWTKGLDFNKPGLSLLASTPGAGYLAYLMSRDDRPGGA